MWCLLSIVHRRLGNIDLSLEAAERAVVSSPDAGAAAGAAAILVTPPPLPPSVSVAFAPFGEVIEEVNSAGVLTQLDAGGAHVLMGGVRSASVAFLGGQEVLDVVTLGGALLQLDGAGAHNLGMLV